MHGPVCFPRRHGQSKITLIIAHQKELPAYVTSSLFYKLPCIIQNSSSLIVWSFCLLIIWSSRMCHLAKCGWKRYRTVSKMDALIGLAVCFWYLMVFGIFKFFSFLNITHWRQNTTRYAGIDGIAGFISKLWWVESEATACCFTTCQDVFTKTLWKARRSFSRES